MIPRLKKRREFLAVAATRRKWVAPGLILQIRKQDSQTASSGTPQGPDQPENGQQASTSENTTGIRVGFTTSRKVGGAVQRNRARRRLRAAADGILPRYAAPGFDFVIIGRRATLTRPWEDLRQDLATALKKLGAAREDGNPGNAGQ